MQEKSKNKEGLAYSCFLINLDIHPDRMLAMDSQLLALDIKYTRIPAIYGKEYIPLKFEYDPNALKIPLLPAEIGCALSHRMIYEKIVKNDIKYSLILEDDVLLPKNFKEVLEISISNNIEKNKWEYLSFNYRFGMTVFYLWLESIVRIFNSDISVWRKILIFIKSSVKFTYILPISVFEEVRNYIYVNKNNFGNVYFYRPLYLAGCYVVTLEGAKKLLELSTPIKYHADKLPNQARIKKGLRFMAFAPMLVDQQLYKYGSSILEINGEEHQKRFKNIFKR